jgi:hypothetical protein
MAERVCDIDGKGTTIDPFDSLGGESSRRSYRSDLHFVVKGCYCEAG